MNLLLTTVTILLNELDSTGDKQKATPIFFLLMLLKTCVLDLFPPTPPKYRLNRRRFHTYSFPFHFEEKLHFSKIFFEIFEILCLLTTERDIYLFI